MPKSLTNSRSLPREYVRQWSACTDCGLHVAARKHAIGRGDLPGDVLFIGEAPGPNEDILGRPFVGKAGKLLNEIIETTTRRLRHDFTYYISNVVACCPWTSRMRIEFREPTRDEAEACSPRLEELLQFVQPQLIVYVGAVAKRLFKAPGFASIQIIHPSSILRMDVPPVNTVEYHASVVRLAEAIQEHVK